MAAALLALTREVPESLARCELTHLARQPIDVARARAQHAGYEDALRAAGCEVRRLPPLPDQPDSVFVEDTAVVVDECAVVTRPGAVSRRAETATVADALRLYRPIRVIEDPGTLDGGDVLRLGRRVFVGLSSRTNEAGAAQLEAALSPFGYEVTRVAVRGRLHLKSAVTAVEEDAVVLDQTVVDFHHFPGIHCLGIDPAEPEAANVLRVGPFVLCPAGAPRTRERLAAAGLRVRPVENSELARAEGGLTCCSLVFAP